MDYGVWWGRKKGPVAVNGFNTKLLDKGSLHEPSKENSLNGNHFASGREKHHSRKKVSSVKVMKTTG